MDTTTRFQTNARGTEGTDRTNDVGAPTANDANALASDEARRLPEAARRAIVYPRPTLGRTSAGVAGVLALGPVVLAIPQVGAQAWASPMAGLLAGVGNLLSAGLTLAALLLLLAGCGCLALGRSGLALGLGAAGMVVGVLDPRWDTALVAGPIGSLIVQLGVLLLIVYGLRVMITGQIGRRGQRRW